MDSVVAGLPPIPVQYALGRAATDEAHDSEEFCYVDRCSGGFYSLTATIPAHEHRWARGVVLSFQFQGIPLDPSPLLQLCRSIGVHDEVYFRPRDEKSVTGVWLPDWMRPIEAVHALVTVPGPVLGKDFVSGLVILNPLRDSSWRDEWQRSGADLNHLDGLHCCATFGVSGVASLLVSVESVR